MNISWMWICMYKSMFKDQFIENSRDKVGNLFDVVSLWFQFRYLTYWNTLLKTHRKHSFSYKIIVYIWNDNLRIVFEQIIALLTVFSFLSEINFSRQINSELIP